MKHVLVVVAFACTVSASAQTTQTDQDLAVQFLYCGLASDFMAKSVPDDHANAKESKAAWQDKRRLFQGSAVVLTTAQYARQEGSRARERFLAAAGKVTAENVDVEGKVFYDTHFKLIEDCTAKFESNKERILGLMEKAR